MRLIPLTSDLLRLAGELDRDPFTAKISNISPLHLTPNYSWAAVDGGYILGAGGVIQNWHGRAEAWMRVTCFARARQIVEAYRWTRAWLDDLQENPGYRRIELHVRADAPFAERQARVLGFALPGHLQRAWGPDGRDYVEFERVR
jgi:hypothetical protein